MIKVSLRVKALFHEFYLYLKGIRAEKGFDPYLFIQDYLTITAQG